MNGISRAASPNGRLVFGGASLKKPLVIGLKTIMAVKTNDLGRIVPEVLKCRGVLQGRHHDHDVLDHTLCAVLKASQMIEMCRTNGPVSLIEGASDIGLEDIFTEDIRNRIWGAMNAATDGVRNEDLFLFAVLLHDIGKPATQKIKHKDGLRPTGEPYYSFEGHTALGTELSQKICQKIGMTELQTDYVTNIVKNHKGPSKLTRSISEGLGYANGIQMNSFSLETVKNRIRNEIILITLADNLSKGKGFRSGLLRDLVATLKNFIERTSEYSRYF